jgi:hypothetical protein
MRTASPKQKKMSPRSSENPTNSGSLRPLAKANPRGSGGASPGAQHPRAFCCSALRSVLNGSGRVLLARPSTTVVRGLLEPDVAGGLPITKQGRAVLAALLMEEDE